MKETNKRMLSLDILRGLTVAGMILVNNPGTWGAIYPPLEHAEWDGLTPTDLIFPFFMFIMGVSTYFSLRKYNFKPTWPCVAKILRRSLVVLLIGWTVAWLALMLRGLNNPDMALSDALLPFDRIRILGVLPRLAICYCATALLAVLLPHRWLKWVVAVFLAGYTAVLLVGYGFEFSERNVIAVVDRALLGTGHMYADTVGGVTLKFDPEGLLSTLPSIAHCLIGLLCGRMLLSTKDMRQRALSMLLAGAALMIPGWLLSYGVPVCKKIWSPTFVLVTCGMACTLLGLLIWVIDIKGRSRWCTFFRVFGVNALFLYALSSVLSLLFSYIKFCFPGHEIKINIHSLIFEDLFVPLCGSDTRLASLCYALTFVAINWCIGYVLYCKKIYIKI